LKLKSHFQFSCYAWYSSHERHVYLTGQSQITAWHAAKENF